MVAGLSVEGREEVLAAFWEDHEYGLRIFEKIAAGECNLDTFLVEIRQEDATGLDPRRYTTDLQKAGRAGTLSVVEELMVELGLTEQMEANRKADKEAQDAAN